MKNFIQKGNTLSVPAPYATASGDGVKVGAIFGVACIAAIQGAELPIETHGVFTMKKVSTEVWTVGQRVYWDDAARLCTSVDAGNTLIGATTASAGNPSSTGAVRLNGSF